jgi:hypothetical protein
MMLLSVMPAMMFGNQPPAPLGNFNVAFSTVLAPEGTIAAQSRLYADNDGAEFRITVNTPPNTPPTGVWLGSSRPTVDAIFYLEPVSNVWYPFTAVGDGLGNAIGVGNAIDISSPLNPAIPSFRLVPGSSTVWEATIKVVSRATGTSQIAFGDCSRCVVRYASGQSFENACPGIIGTHTGSIANVVEGRRFPIQFTAPRANFIRLNVVGADSGKPANMVDYYTMRAFVATGAAGVPVSGERVTFSIFRGAGASLSVTSATTNASGTADVRVFANRPGEVTVRATINAEGVGDGINRDTETVTFIPTGVARLTAVSPTSGALVARDPGFVFGRNVSAFDINGNRIDMWDVFGMYATTGVNANLDATFFDFGANGVVFENYTHVIGEGNSRDVNFRDTINLTTTIISKPAGAALVATDISFRAMIDGNFAVRMPHDRLNRDGDYEVRVHLPNGSSASFQFNVRDLGTVTELRLTYGATSYSAGTLLPQPSVHWVDADGYSIVRLLSAARERSELALSISDAAFMATPMHETQGTFLIREDRTGPITMTLVDRTLNMVATRDLTISLPASYLKLTAPAVSAIGTEAVVNIEVVDRDGNLAVTGLRAVTGESRAAVVSSPDGAVTGLSNVLTHNFHLNGTASVRISSNVDGNVIVQVIIVEAVGTVPGTGVLNPLYDPGAEQVGGNVPWLIAPTRFGGRTFTGAATVAFGTAAEGAGTLIFIIGAPSFVSGNRPYSAESPAVIENGRTLLGVRDVTTAIGGAATWDQDTQTATVTKDNVAVRVTVGASAIVVTRGNVSTEVPIDVPALNRNGRVYLPMRALLEAFGYEVTWDDATQAIIAHI